MGKAAGEGGTAPDIGYHKGTAPVPKAPPVLYAAAALPVYYLLLHTSLPVCHAHPHTTPLKPPLTRFLRLTHPHTHPGVSLHHRSPPTMQCLARRGPRWGPLTLGMA